MKAIVNDYEIDIEPGAGDIEPEFDEQGMLIHTEGDHVYVVVTDQLTGDVYEGRLFVSTKDRV